MLLGMILAFRVCDLRLHSVGSCTETASSLQHRIRLLGNIGLQLLWSLLACCVGRCPFSMTSQTDYGALCAPAPCQRHAHRALVQSCITERRCHTITKLINIKRLHLRSWVGSWWPAVQQPELVKKPVGSGGRSVARPARSPAAAESKRGVCFWSGFLSTSRSAPEQRWVRPTACGSRPWLQTSGN